jgi:pyruvate-ferredoxin/flavodoxin oxidoreductase
MQGVVARRNNFTEPILHFLEEAYKDFGELTGRHYGLITQYKTEDADTVFVSLGSAAENIEAAVDYLRERRNAKVGSIHLNVFRPFPEAAVIQALSAAQRHRSSVPDEPMSGDNPMGREIRRRCEGARDTRSCRGSEPSPVTPDRMPRLLAGIYGLGSRDFRPEHVLAPTNSQPTADAQGRCGRCGWCLVFRPGS